MCSIRVYACGKVDDGNKMIEQDILFCWRFLHGTRFEHVENIANYNNKISSVSRPVRGATVRIFL